MTAARVTAVLLLAGAAGLAADVAGHWRADPTAVDRYLILAAAGWTLAARWRAATAGGIPRSWLGLPLVAAGAAVYPVGWAAAFVLVNARSLPLWGVWFGLALATVGWVITRYGFRPAYRVLFPVAAVVLALPPPESVIRPLQQRLQVVTTDLSEALLRGLGYPVAREPGSFVLVLPGGELGVEESCSGLQALTALTAVAAFAAHWRRFGLARGAGLVATAVPVVVGVNVVRVVLSGVVQETWGAAYVRGGWHDALGFATVLLGLGVLWAVALWVAPRRPAPPPPPIAPSPARWLPAVVAAGLLATGLVATAVVLAVGPSRVPPPVPIPDLDALPTALGGWEEVRRLDVPPHVAAMLEPDATAHREYRSAIGQSAFVWVIHWAAADRVRGYHHPDICLPNVGYLERGRGVQVLYPAGGEVPATARTLDGPGGELYVLYWTQTGRRVWGPADEAEASAATTIPNVLRRAAARWADPTPPEPAGRLVVLVGSPNPTPFGREELDRFAADVAGAIYRLCPEAAPPVPPAD